MVLNAEIEEGLMSENVIWKYDLKLGVQVIPMPQFAKVLTAQEQRGAVRLWVFVDPTKPPEARKFEVIGTGQTVDWWIGNDRKYVATVQQGGYVWHVFEVRS